MQDCAVRPTSPSCGRSARVVLGTTEKGSNLSGPSFSGPRTRRLRGTSRECPGARARGPLRRSGHRPPRRDARPSCSPRPRRTPSAQARSSARAALATPSAVSSPAGTSYAVAPATGVTPSAASWPVSRSRRRAVGVVRRPDRQVEVGRLGLRGPGAEHAVQVDGGVLVGEHVLEDVGLGHGAASRATRCWETEADIEARSRASAPLWASTAPVARVCCKAASTVRSRAMASAGLAGARARGRCARRTARAPPGGPGASAPAAGAAGAGAGSRAGRR